MVSNMLLFFWVFVWQISKNCLDYFAIFTNLLFKCLQFETPQKVRSLIKIHLTYTLFEHLALKLADSSY